MTIFEYIRLSSEDDDLKEGEKPESNSIANQRNLINTYIQSHEEFAGADVVEFCDDGWSGKSFERPAVKEMLEQVRLGKAQCIIVKDISGTAGRVDVGHRALWLYAGHPEEKSHGH